MQKITPCLWFDGQAEQAMQFYSAVFPRCELTSVTRYGDAGPGPPGSVMTVTFTLDGQEFIGLNGGPHYHFTPAISMLVKCGSQAEIDHYWGRLSAGGSVQRCGWLTDRFGVSWQVFPTRLGELMQDGDAASVARVMSAMMKMIKLDVAELERAAQKP